MKKTWWVLALSSVVLVTGCSPESIAENAIEKRIEAESGEDVDIDLSEGNFSVKTDEGAIEFNSDGDGNFTIQGTDSDGGDVSVNAEDGVVVVESEDGNATFTQGGDLPDGFPDVPLPDGLTILFTQEGDAGAGTGYTLVGSAPGEFGAYLNTLTGYLESNGYTQQQLTTTPDGAFFSYSSDTEVVAGSLGNDTASGGMSVSLQIMPNS